MLFIFSNGPVTKQNTSTAPAQAQETKTATKTEASMPPVNPLLNNARADDQTAKSEVNPFKHNRPALVEGATLFAKGISPDAKPDTNSVKDRVENEFKKKSARDEALSRLS